MLCCGGGNNGIIYHSLPGCLPSSKRKRVVGLCGIVVFVGEFEFARKGKETGTPDKHRAGKRKSRDRENRIEGKVFQE